MGHMQYAGVAGMPEQIFMRDRTSSHICAQYIYIKVYRQASVLSLAIFLATEFERLLIFNGFGQLRSWFGIFKNPILK